MDPITQFKTIPMITGAAASGRIKKGVITIPISMYKKDFMLFDNTIAINI